MFKIHGESLSCAGEEVKHVMSAQCDIHSDRVDDGEPFVYTSAAVGVNSGVLGTNYSDYHRK